MQWLKNLPHRHHHYHYDFEKGPWLRVTNNRQWGEGFEHQEAACSPYAVSTTASGPLTHKSSSVLCPVALHWNLTFIAPLQSVCMSNQLLNENISLDAHWNVSSTLTVKKGLSAQNRWKLWAGQNGMLPDPHIGTSKSKLEPKKKKKYQETLSQIYQTLQTFFPPFKKKKIS